MRILSYADSESWAGQLKSLADNLSGEAAIAVPSRELAERVSGIYNQVYFSELGFFEPASYAGLLAKASADFRPDASLFPCTNKGRILSGLQAAALSAMAATDVISARQEGDHLIVRRLVYGGRAIVDLQLSFPAVICVTQGSYKEQVPGGAHGKITELEAQTPASRVEFRPKKSEGVEPDKSDVVVVAGRGIRSKEDLEMVKELARELKGAWSVTRPLAADYGWADSWIGISGLTISPKLYVGVGVSGQPHHTMGIRSSKAIVSINKDPDAPIFEESDYGIVGDLYIVVPLLLKRLKEVA